MILFQEIWLQILFFDNHEEACEFIGVGTVSLPGFDNSLVQAAIAYEEEKLMQYYKNMLWLRTLSAEYDDEIEDIPADHFSARLDIVEEESVAIKDNSFRYNRLMAAEALKGDILFSAFLRNISVSNEGDALLSIIYASKHFPDLFFNPGHLRKVINFILEPGNLDLLSEKFIEDETQESATGYVSSYHTSFYQTSICSLEDLDEEKQTVFKPLAEKIAKSLAEFVTEKMPRGAVPDATISPVGMGRIGVGAGGRY